MNDKPSILIVDDEVTNRTIATGILAAAGWDVQDVEDGESAVAAMQNGRYALILMDVQMPGLDGFGATRAIRAAGGLGASVPILAFTSVPPGDAIERARQAGMDGHIAKPFTPETLLAAVEPWRPDGRSHPAAPLAAIFGHAEISAMLARFRDQLAEALATDDDTASRQARAHKIGGISGTLGFADVSRTWLAVSEGDESAWEDARAAARRAMRTIDASGDLAADR